MTHNSQTLNRRHFAVEFQNLKCEKLCLWSYEECLAWVQCNLFSNLSCIVILKLWLLVKGKVKAIIRLGLWKEGNETNSFEIASLVPEIWVPRYWEFCTYIWADNKRSFLPHTKKPCFFSFCWFPRTNPFSLIIMRLSTTWVGFESHMTFSQSLPLLRPA